MASAPATEKRSIDATYVVAAVAIVILLSQRFIMPQLTYAPLKTWATVFVSICIQAMPFLVAGTLISAVVAILIPASFFRRVVPKNPVLAVPAACAGGFLLPGCECASVPVSHSLIKRGVAPAAALTFLLAAPAINPIVLVATAVAFAGQTEFVWARLLASVLTSITIGWLWLALRRPDLIKLPDRKIDSSLPKAEQFRAAAMHDLLHAGGFLVVGALFAASMNVLLPNEVLRFVAERPWLAIIAMAVFAFIVAMCSEADAFVAASFSMFGPTAQLVFMVVGPAVDVKLVSMQSGTFGRKFAAIFAPTTFVVAILSAVLVGWWLL